ncbi:MAG: hypothetical protein ACYTHN_11190 [Planctomycetota bacterium]|jgi:hypothetical protein
MKKYILAALPFLLGAALSFLLAFREATYDPGTHHQTTPGILHNLSLAWLLIGFFLSVMFFLVFLIWDASSWVEKKLERRSMKRSKGP